MGSLHNAKLRAQVVPAGPHEATGGSELTAPEPVCAHTRPVRMSWARLLKRVFEIDLGALPELRRRAQDHCGHP